MRRHPGRTASLSWGPSAFVISAVVLAGLIGLLVWKPAKEIDKTPLVVYCAAGLKAPVEEAARDYEKEYGVPVQLHFGGSETLLSNVQVTGRGDLYIPADVSYIDMATAKGLVEEKIPLARMGIVVAVRKGNPKKISSLADLLRKDVTLIQANPEGAAVAKLTRDVLGKLNKWEALKEKTRALKGTVTEVATDVQLGKADAGFVWDVTVAQFGKHLDAVKLPELQNVHSSVTLGVLRSCHNPSSALRFARYLAARDRGLKVFADHHFVPVPDGDLWSGGEPTITLYIGAMLRPAVADTIAAFAQREGIPEENIRIVYNGCGVLVAQMKAGQRPDAFFACDARFLDDQLKAEEPQGDKIRDLFLDASEVSGNRLAILVPKGNPKKIRSLHDLARPGMRIGVGDEHKCAMGILTEEALNRIWDPRKKKSVETNNIKVRSGSGDILVSQFLSAPNKLDAVVAYVTNARQAEDRIDLVPIDLDCNRATQPIAPGMNSNHKYLVGRLIQAIKSDESRERFKESGFEWKAKR